MAAKEKFEVRGRISQKAKGATERISRLLDRSQSSLLEQMVLTWEALWLQHMTATERTKYLAGELSITEAVEIGVRRHPPSNGIDWLTPLAFNTLINSSFELGRGEEKGAA
jgi:hypothetical protein